MDSPADKPYDLEQRTELFAKRVRAIVKRLPRTICNYEDVRQLVRSSGSIGANYIEANEALSKKDFLHRVKICRKESKGSRFWLLLVDVGTDVNTGQDRSNLMQEATELMKIFGGVAGGLLGG